MLLSPQFPHTQIPLFLSFTLLSSTTDGLISAIFPLWQPGCYGLTPHFLFFTLLYSFLVMWSSCDHIVTHCSCDIYCSVTSIVLWPIVQGDSIVPVMPIVLVTLLFSNTISTSSLWPYSLRLDFLYLTVQTSNQSPFPTLIPCPFPLKVFTLKPLIA